jgi:NADH:ubiquinone oxidoreductase subunit E
MADLDARLLQSIPGISEVMERFGYWPSFHDAEIISLLLDRESDSVLKVHTFETLREVNDHGQYRTAKHSVVCFVMSDIQALHLDDFNAQNVIFGLGLSKVGDVFTVTLDCCYGLCGSISAKSLRVVLELGVPAGSIYGTNAAPSS